MKKLYAIYCYATLFFGMALSTFAQDQGYKNFQVSMYTRSYEVIKMGDLKWLEDQWEEITRQVHIDKVYLETHRDLVIVNEDTLRMVKKFFEDRGIETAGGITLTVYEPNRFETFCYSNPEHRKIVQEVVELTARNFDELILDDFFFTSCKCEKCIAAKGDQSWTKFRLKLMDEVARKVIIGPAKAVNPNIKTVIKYPNWYEHFQGLGFNLETEPKIFDGIYTGTETRDAFMSNQHLQQYLGYNVFRYFDNIKPDGNGGGWVDTGGAFNLDRYAEQLWITLFAKAPEITLFDFRQLIGRTLDQFKKADWQGQGTSFDLEKMMTPIGKGKKKAPPTTVARAAGYTFELIDPIMSEMGNPIGLAAYRPYHSVGEDFLHNYLGMIGIPIDLKPEFPVDAPMVLLTETAKYDKDIVSKIKQQLVNGKSVIITTGLLKVLQGKGIEDIAELRCNDDKMLVDTFIHNRREIGTSNKKLSFPQIKYLTNDSWEIISAIDGPNGWPILHEAEYANGSLFVLAIPDNYADLYHLPSGVLNLLRNYLQPSMPVILEAPGIVSIFVYDNDTFIVESFMDEEAEVAVTTQTDYLSIEDLQSKEKIVGKDRPAERRGWGLPKDGDKKVFNFNIKPHSFRAFKMVK